MGQLPGGAALARAWGGARRKERRPDKACMPPSGINGAHQLRRLTARRHCACAGLRGSRRPPQERRSDKACMPPSGTTAGAAPDRPAALRLRGPTGVSRRPPQERRPDKAFMPPSGTTAGTAPDRPAALRLRGPGGVSRTPPQKRRPDKAFMPPSGINGAHQS